MSSKTLYRLSGGALVAGALMFAVGYLLSPHGEDVSRYASPLYVPGGVLTLLGALGLLIGLSGMYARQAERAGKLGLVSFAMTFLGLAVLEVSTGSVFTFVAPVLAANPETQELVAQPGALDQALGPAFLAYMAPGLLGLNLGILLLGIATLRAGVFPRGAAIILVVGTPAIFVLGGLLGRFGENVAVAATMLGFVWCGYTLLRGRPQAVSSARVEAAPQP